jgi:general secretion pathway protein A
MKSVARRSPPFPARAFQPSADRGSLWLAGQYDDALRMLRSAVLGRQGLLALVGEPGTGKTVLAHALTVRLQDEGVVVGRLLYPILEGMDLRAAIAEAFGLTAPMDPASFAWQFQSFVSESAESGRRVLLLVDHAQQLSSELLLELTRMATAAGVPASPGPSVLLVGQRALLETLRAEGVDPDVLCHLQPLTREQTAEYISHRLRAAGHTTRYFTPSALRKIWVVSEGIPRVVNALSIEALGGVQAPSSRKVTASLIHRTPREEPPAETPEAALAEVEPPIVVEAVVPPPRRRRVRWLVGAALAASVLAAVATSSDHAPWLSAQPAPTTASPIPDDAAKAEPIPDFGPSDPIVFAEDVSTATVLEPVSPAVVAAAPAAPPAAAFPPRPARRAVVSRARPVEQSRHDVDPAAAIDWLLKKQRVE